MLSVLSIVRDITALAQTNEAARQNAQRLQGIIDSQLDLFCRYTPDGVLTFVNDAYCTFFGRSPSALLGHSFLDELARPEQTALIRARMQELARDPSPTTLVYDTVDAHGNRRWIQWLDFGITDGAGQLVEIQAVGRDITARVNAQAALAASEQRFRKAIEEAPFPISIYAEDGEMLHLSRTWLEITGYTWEQLPSIPGLDPPGLRRRIRAHARDHRPAFCRRNPRA
ncbi:MAG: PAS domain S-box protein [Anaerolineae bacterium]|nr:PAS domain S-box protein [Anaerolineae bacterium]